MSDLTEFILARIADDEAVARAADAPYFLYDLESKAGEQYDHIARHDPARVLAQCAALRRIVAAHEPRHDEGFSVPMCGTCDESWPCDTMAALATVYADRPGFDARWGM